MKILLNAASLILIGIFLTKEVSARTYLQEVREHEVSGTVTDETYGDALPGVNIVVKGTTIGTSTDSEGNYYLRVPSQSDTLVVTYVGYQEQLIPINGSAIINIELMPQAIIGEEVLVTGYQIQRKADLTGAVGVANIEDIETIPSGNPIKSLQGRIPGLYINSSGAPNGGASVLIRGVSTLGNNSPLFVIDGVPSKSGAYQELTANDIESIQVLKDASSASIYGARASNGVVIITTKKASDNVQVDFNSSISIQSYTTKLDVLNTQQRGQVLWQAAINDGLDPATIPIYDYVWHQEQNGSAVLDEVIVPEWIDQGLGIRSADTDWYDEISQMGIISSNNISVSSGNERGGVVFSLGHIDNEGIVKETDFGRISGRINSNYQFFDGRFKVGENLQVTTTKETPMPSGLGGTPVWLALIQQPILPVYTEDGQWAGPSGAGFSDRDNPVRLIEHNRWDKINTAKIFGNVYTDLELLKNLTFKTNFGIDYVHFYNRFISRTFQSGFLSRDINSLQTAQSENINWNWSNTLNWDLSFGDHNATVLGGMEAVNNSYQSFSAYSEEFSFEENEYFTHDASSGRKLNSGFETGFKLLSYFGKVNYRYKNKYLASGTLRYDGSSRFGEDNRFGLFPAFSLGWRVSSEDFINNNIESLSNLKFRFGWGQVGNSEIANEAAYALFSSNYGDDKTWGASNGTAYDISGIDTGNLPSGYLSSQTGNPNLRWEATSESNFGVDFGFFEDKLTGSADYFIRKTDDILIQPAYIAVLGDGGGQWINGASVETKGFEAILTYRNNAGQLGYALSANVGAFKDEITHLPETVVDSYPGNVEKNILGRSQFSIFGYVADGIFKNQGEVDSHADQTGKGLGRIRFKDLNDDGVINTLDQKFIGVAAPDFEIGFNASFDYKNFNLNMFFQGISGIDVFNDMKAFTDFTSIAAGANYGARTLEAWSPSNPNSGIPALSLSDNNNETRTSTYFIENGSYLKLRTMQLGYTIPDNLLSRLGIANAKIYLQGENLLTIKDYSGPDEFTATDPENPGNAYPRPRKLTLGLNVSF